jgi:hypothetical protein
MGVIAVSDLSSYSKLDLSADSKAALVVAAVNQWIINYTGRSFGVTTVVTNEIHDYRPSLWLDHQDVQTIQAVRVGYPNQTAQALPSNNYFVNEYGRLVLNLSGVDIPGRGNYDLISVDYSYGRAAVPDDLKLAAMALAFDFYQDQGSNGAISMAMVGQLRLQFKGGDQYNSVFDSYRQRRI